MTFKPQPVQHPETQQETRVVKIREDVSTDASSSLYFGPF